MATIYYSSATAPGVPPRGGTGLIIQDFSFTYAATVVTADQVALIWIPKGAKLFDWHLNHTSFAASGATLTLGDFTNAVNAFMGSSTVKPANTALIRSLGSDGEPSASGGVGNIANGFVYNTVQTMTGYTNIPPGVADVFRLTIGGTLGTPANATKIGGFVRYVMS